VSDRGAADTHPNELLGGRAGLVRLLLSKSERHPDFDEHWHDHAVFHPRRKEPFLHGRNRLVVLAEFGVERLRDADSRTVPSISTTAFMSINPVTFCFIAQGR